MPADERRRELLSELRAAQALLDQLVADRTVEYFQPMTDVVRKLISIRDALIAQCRRATGGNEHAPAALKDLNAAISVAIGAQFPVVGIKRERIEHTRDAVRAWTERYGAQLETLAQTTSSS